MLVTRTSITSDKTNTLDLNVTEEQMKRFEVRSQTGEYIQHIFPNLLAHEREFILSGITKDEWDEIFSND